MPTTGRGFRYPALTDDVDVPQDIGNLAADVQDELDGTLAVGALTTSGTINGQTISASPYFRAYRGTAVSVATGAVVIFDTEDGDPNNWYDPATGKFQPTRAGRYLTSWGVTLGSTVANDVFMRADLYKGAGVAADGQVAVVRSSVTLNSTGTVLVTANGSTDYFQVLLTHSVGSATPLYPTTAGTHFEAVYVGA